MVDISYIFVSSDKYTSDGNAKLDQSNLNSFQIAPGLKMSANLQDGFGISVKGRYVFEFSNDLDASVFGVNRYSLPELDSKSFAEYGLSMSKTARDYYQFELELNRRDGDRTGWIGGVNAKFFF